MGKRTKGVILTYFLPKFYPEIGMKIASTDASSLANKAPSGGRARSRIMPPGWTW